MDVVGVVLASLSMTFLTSIRSLISCNDNYNVGWAMLLKLFYLIL